MKYKKITIFSLVSIVTMCIVVSFMIYKKKRERCIRTYTTEVSVNKFNQLKQDKNAKNKFVYIGNSNCSDCSLFDPELINSIRDHHINEKMLYVDVNKLHENKKEWKKFRQENNIYGTPSFIYLGNNQKTLSHRDTSAPRIDELKKWIKKCKNSN